MEAAAALWCRVSVMVEETHRAVQGQREERAVKSVKSVIEGE